MNAYPAKLDVHGTIVRVISHNGSDYVCITDIAALKNPLEPKDVVKNWMRNRSTLAFLGLWEKLHNPDFKGVDFDPLLAKAGDNAFTMSPTRWIAEYQATGILAKSGRSGGTFAHRDIAFEFASWVSAEFKLYLITEFERLKAKEQEQIGWSAKRELAKINYRIHTDAIQRHLVPPTLTRAQTSVIYANEADVLNVALFGQTHQQWQAAHPDLPGNQRDYATVNQLICLSNLENVNAVMINDGIPQPRRLRKLNEIAIQQMRILAEVGGRKLLRDPAPP
ncbi:MAG: KilA-N domain-containing protein [Kiritimatiellae bacterium]|nr:KilA-N domain-containing protein [Kiritimatiellia bacterium]